MSKSARDLHENLRMVEQADDITTELQMELRKILFKKTTEVMGGLKRQYCATLTETRHTIKNLLRIRRDFMAARGLHDAHPASSAASQRDGPSGGASQPTDHRYLFTPEDRRLVMQGWKEKFHAMGDQVKQQKRDSWKPTGPPSDAHDTWGPNMKAVRSGKHSRFARHLQLAAGSKTMAELIIYTGRFDPDFLSQAHDAQDRSGASQPGAEPAVQKLLKRAAATAKLDYRKTCILRRRLDQGKVQEWHLSWWDLENLRKLQDGSLLSRTNEAVAAFGHGTLRHGYERVEIGGSTGGVTRFLLDGYAEPDVDTFLARS